MQLALQVDGPEVLVASFVILSGWAIYKQHEAASAKQAVESPAEMLLLPASKVDVLGASSNTRFVPKASDVELIVVKPDKALGKSSSTPVRGYDATTTKKLTIGAQNEDVTVRIKRGTDDKTATAFSADLVGAEHVYLLAP